MVQISLVCQKIKANLISHVITPLKRWSVVIPQNCYCTITVSAPVHHIVVPGNVEH